MFVLLGWSLHEAKRIKETSFNVRKMETYSEPEAQKSEKAKKESHRIKMVSPVLLDNTALPNCDNK